MEVILGLVNVLAEGFVLEFAVVASGLEEIAGGVGDLSFVELGCGIVAEGGLGGIYYELN